MNEPAIRIGGLDKADARELTEYVPEEAVTVEEAPTPEDAFGELALAAAIIGVSAIALKGFVAWLAYRNANKSESYEVEYRTPDGAWVKHKVKIDSRSKEPADVQLAKQLSTVTGLDWQLILQGA